MAGLSERLRIYIEDIPKAELHIHIEGTLEPSLMFRLAARNGITLEGTVESHEEKRKSFKVNLDVLSVDALILTILCISKSNYSSYYELALDGVSIVT